MRHRLGVDVGKTGLRVGVYGVDRVLDQHWSFPTADVDKAQGAVKSRLGYLKKRYEISSARISIFGPLQVDPALPNYGAVIESSEPAWSGVNIPLLVANVLGQDVWFDFDVNAGALAEAELGNGRGKSSFVYLSLGTGIGAAPFRGAHRTGFAPQMGHMYIPREADDLEFRGSCRFHGACLQGLASGKAMAERWGRPAEAIEADHPAWDLEARYIARACTNLVYCFAPEAILLGSSIGSASGLSILEVNRYLMGLLNNFLEPELRHRYAAVPPVVRAAYGSDCSLVGAALLGEREAGLLYRYQPSWESSKR